MHWSDYVTILLRSVSTMYETVLQNVEKQTASKNVLLNFFHLNDHIKDFVHRIRHERRIRWTQYQWFDSDPNDFLRERWAQVERYWTKAF